MVNGNGITVNFAKNATIVDNMIKLSGNTTNGISLTSCDSSTVSCNTVIGRYPTVNYLNRGIYGSMNQKCYISCNITDSLYKGVHFSSSNIATKFRGNEMKKHYIGLYLDNTAVIDTQSHAGNMWTGTYNSTYGAWNENDSLTSQLFASLFIVDPVLGTFYNPNIPLGINPGEPNDQGWFDQIVGGNTYSCTGSLLCADRPIERSPGSGNLKEAIASGDVLTTDYIDESKSTAKMFLYEDLKKDSLLYSNNPVLMQFLSNNASTVFGKINNTKQLMQESFTIDSLYILQINEKDSLLKIHLNNVKTLDSLAAADSTIDNLTTRENEIDDIAIIKQDMSNISSATNTNKVAKLNDATTWNNAVQPSEIPEYNLKQVNEINIIYEKTNSKDSIAQYYGTLLNIAEQCPQSGGMAVYVARSLVSLFNDTLVYDDDNVCLQQGYFRMAQKANKKSISSDIAIIPNPADEMTQIILSKKQEGVCKVGITDAYSKSVYTNEFDCKTQHLTISTKGLVQGIYFVEIKINGSSVKTAKLIIAR